MGLKLDDSMAEARAISFSYPGEYVWVVLNNYTNIPRPMPIVIERTQIDTITFKGYPLGNFHNGVWKDT